MVEHIRYCLRHEVVVPLALVFVAVLTFFFVTCFDLGLDVVGQFGRTVALIQELHDAR